MVKLNSQTPKYASFWPRLLSLLLDSTVVTIPYFAFQKSLSLDQTGAIAFFLAADFFGIFYYVLLLCFFGQTLGMMAVKIKVVRLDLSSLQWKNAFMRYSVTFLIGIIHFYVLTCFILDAPADLFPKTYSDLYTALTNSNSSLKTFMHYFLLVSLLWTNSEMIVLLLNKKRRAIHDFIAGTVVVHINREKEIVTEPAQPKASSGSKISTTFLIALVLLYSTLISFLPFQSRKSFRNLFLSGKKVDLGPIGVRKGDGFVTTNSLLQDDRLEDVKDIAADRQNPSLIWIASHSGIMSIQSNGQITNFASLPIRGIHDYRWIDLDNKIALMNVGDWVSTPALFDTSGKELWNYGSGVNNMASCFNILGDSKTEFVVGFVSDGLHLLDENGHVVWKVPETTVWHVETTDLNDDGKIKIVHSNSAGNLVVRNPDGSIFKECKPPVYPAHFTLTDWLNPDGPTVAILTDQTKYLFYSFSKEAVVAQWEAGFKLDKSATRAAWVVWNPNSGKSLVLLSRFLGSDQSMLSIYSESGEMQYQENLPESCEGLGVVDGPTPGSHVLLIGIENKVVQYQKPIS